MPEAEYDPYVYDVPTGIEEFLESITRHYENPSPEEERRRLAILNSGMLLENNPLKFNKTGKEIKIALEARKAELTKEDEDIVKEIEEIAKRRELDPAEVIKAADNEQLIESYSTKALNAVVGSARHMPGGNMAFNVPKTFVEALQMDVERLKELGRSHGRVWRQLRHIDIIQKHVEPEKSFELSYQVLLLLGFE